MNHPCADKPHARARARVTRDAESSCILAASLCDGHDGAGHRLENRSVARPIAYRCNAADDARRLRCTEKLARHRHASWLQRRCKDRGAEAQTSRLGLLTQRVGQADPFLVPPPSQMSTRAVAVPLPTATSMADPTRLAEGSSYSTAPQAAPLQRLARRCALALLSRAQCHSCSDEHRLGRVSVSVSACVVVRGGRACRVPAGVLILD